MDNDPSKSDLVGTAILREVSLESLVGREKGTTKLRKVTLKTVNKELRLFVKFS